jgi:hypothetical protein
VLLAGKADREAITLQEQAAEREQLLDPEDPD